MSHLLAGLRPALRSRVFPLAAGAAVVLAGIIPATAVAGVYRFDWVGSTASPPAVNRLTAGGARTIRFSLGGDHGLDVLAAGWPRSQRYDCSTGELLAGTQAPTVAESAGLRYDGVTGVYAYAWQTVEGWGGTCRRFELRLADGSVHVARFRLTPFRFADSVSRMPDFNRAAAGSIERIDFHLGGAPDRVVFAPGSPRSAPIDCRTMALTGPWSPAAPRGDAGLTRTQFTGEYHYRWETRAAWDDTCRRLELRLADGTRQSLAFVFNAANAEPVVETTWVTVDEHAPVGTVLGGPPAFTDPDPRDQHRYSIRTYGVPEAVAIHPTTGVVTVANPWLLNYHEGTDETVRGVAIEVTDDGTPPLTGVGAYMIRIRDVNVAPYVYPATFSIAEDAPAGTLVGDPIAVLDRDEEVLFSFAITGGNDAGAFDIDPQTGQLSVADAAALDHETLPVAELVVSVTDHGEPAGTGSATITVNVTDVAGELLPVGGAQHYLGVGHFVGATTTTSSSTVSGSQRRATSTPLDGTWSSPANVAANDNAYASAFADGASHQWGTFGFDSVVPDDPTLEVVGIQVRLQDVFLAGSGTSTGCRVAAELSWDGGASFSAIQQTAALTTFATADQDIGSANSMSAWGSHVWTRGDLLNGVFRVRLTWSDGTESCEEGRSVDLDDLDVQVSYRTTITTTTTTIAPKDVLAPSGGSVLEPQGFWTAMQSQGSPSIQGDPYLTRYETRTSMLNAAYDPEGYYHYGVELPDGATDGEVWLFDPGFCEVSTTTGTGEFWTIGGANGASTAEPVSAFFELFDTMGTPHDRADDLRVDPTGDDDMFRRLSLHDEELSTLTHGTASCKDLAWHNGWWRLATGLPGGRTYRLHTVSTDRAEPSDQSETTAVNGFSIYASATGGTPRVYGLGAMEAYIRLPESQQSAFAFTRVDARHAGERLVLELWDPGDTASLAASLEVLQPTATGYAPVTFDWTSTKGTASAGASNCDGLSGTGVTSVVANTGGSSRFNGCWLTITVALPDDYAAPHPSSETAHVDGGWWKLRYTTGNGPGDFATDLTTWKARIAD